MPVSKVTLNDGTTTVAVDGRATVSGLQHRIEPIGGSGVIQFMDGSSEKHTNWQKLRITITASGWQPPQLDAIDYSQPITLTIHDWAAGTKDYTVFCNRPVTNDDMKKSSTSWTLVATEVG